MNEFVPRATTLKEPLRRITRHPRWITGGDSRAIVNAVTHWPLNTGPLTCDPDQPSVAESTTLFVKRFVHRGWIEQIWARWCLVFGKSRAGGEYRNARRLMNHNIPVVESLAYADRVTSFRCTDSLLVTRFLADATTAKESAAKAIDNLADGVQPALMIGLDAKRADEGASVGRRQKNDESTGRN